jgi:hypothetical protein
MNLTYIVFPPHDLGRKRKALVDTRIRDVGKCIRAAAIELQNTKRVRNTELFVARVMGAQYAPQDTQLGSIMHEMTHMFCGTVDIGRDGTDGTAYGEQNCIQNALSSVDRARNNADNYCYYLTQLYFTSAVKNPWVVHY